MLPLDLAGLRRGLDSIKEHGIPRAPGQQFARRCAGRFRNSRCERSVAFGSECG